LGSQRKLLVPEDIPRRVPHARPRRAAAVGAHLDRRLRVAWPSVLVNILVTVECQQCGCTSFFGPFMGRCPEFSSPTRQPPAWPASAQAKRTQGRTWTATAASRRM